MFSRHDASYDQIREGVGSLCAAYPGTYWRDLDRERAYPTEFVEALTDAGYLAALIPEEYGGAGLDLKAACVILETIQRSGCNAGACHAQMYTMGTLLRHGSEEQKRHFLPRIAEGSLRLQAFGVSEPTCGTDTTRIRTTAVRDGDAYVVKGQKTWISRAEHSDLMLLLARTTPRDDVEKSTDGMSVFLVDLRDEIGKTVTIRPIETLMNHSTTEVFFDGTRVPAANRIGGEGQGFWHILDGMNAERVLIAAECIGDARYFVERASGYAAERQVFDRPIGQNQGVQFPIAEAHMETEAAALMAEKAASLFDDAKPCGAEANMAKYLAAEASWKAADVCMQTLGGFAFSTEYDVARKFRETRLYRVAPISTNLILSHVATHVLGMPKSF
ncbi:MAG: acyl-CoA/acyl-ACP dehydrogenase [Gemmatimonadetes bacterium]|nr:acyl-CoA/acyl-ACP dehydrogenase [Gemmatimonadota bacterium]